MKHIKKTRSRELIIWTRQNPNQGYRGGSFPTSIVHEHLLNEQGHICAYTMQRLKGIDSHNEHMIPVRICGDDGTKGDIDINNIVACYTDISNSYGATKKDDWYCPETFLKPTLSACEKEIVYKRDGSVAGTTRRAEVTIDKLGLDHLILREYRKKAISSMLKGTQGGFYHLFQFAEQGWCKRHDERLPEYCMVLKHVADSEIESLKKAKRKRKQKAIHSKRNEK